MQTFSNFMLISLDASPLATRRRMMPAVLLYGIGTIVVALPWYGDGIGTIVVDVPWYGDGIGTIVVDVPWYGDGIGTIVVDVPWYGDFIISFNEFEYSYCDLGKPYF